MKFQGALCKMRKKPTQVFTALFLECFDVQIHLIKTKTAKMQIPETPWEKAREGNALSVQELAISAAMANFVPLSRTCSGPSIPRLKTLWPGSTRLGRQQSSAPPSAEPAARHRSTAAPLDRKWVSTWPPLLQHPFTVIWFCLTDPRFSWRK